jgi:hypothetical protein
VHPVIAKMAAAASTLGRTKLCACIGNSDQLQNETNR